MPVRVTGGPVEPATVAKVKAPLNGGVLWKGLPRVSRPRACSGSPDWINKKSYNKKDSTTQAHPEPGHPEPGQTEHGTRAETKGSCHFSNSIAGGPAHSKHSPSKNPAFRLLLSAAVTKTCSWPFASRLPPASASFFRPRRGSIGPATDKNRAAMKARH